MSNTPWWEKTHIDHRMYRMKLKNEANAQSLLPARSSCSDVSIFKALRTRSDCIFVQVNYCCSIKKKAFGAQSITGARTVRKGLHPKAVM